MPSSVRERYHLTCNQEPQGHRRFESYTGLKRLLHLKSSFYRVVSQLEEDLVWDQESSFRSENVGSSPIYSTRRDCY